MFRMNQHIGIVLPLGNIFLRLKRGTMLLQTPDRTTKGTTKLNLRTLVTWSTSAYFFSCKNTVASGFSSSIVSSSFLLTSSSFRRVRGFSHFLGSSSSVPKHSGFEICPTKIIGSTTTPTFLFVLRGGSTMASSATASQTTKNDAHAAEKDPKLAALRSIMAELGIDAYLVPSDDPHLSEYVPAAYMRRAYLTGFKGSAGTALVTMKEAFLWTDSRYFNEATARLDANHWKLMKAGQPKVPTIVKFLSDLAIDKFNTSKITFRVGIDPYVHSALFAKQLTDAFQSASDDVIEQNDNGEQGNAPVVGEIDTLDARFNLIDEIWSDRPAIPTSPFRVHPLKYAGVSVLDKVAQIRAEMKEKKVTFSVYTALDDVAYLFNVRAKGDVDTCPVGIAYATISQDSVILYCDEAKLKSDEVKTHLNEANVIIKSYDDVVRDIESHVAEQKNAKVWIDKSRANYALSRVVPDKKLLDAQNAVTRMKGCKNAAEMENMRQAHIADGVAMAHFMAWLEHAIVTEGRSVSEVEIDEKLTGFRAQQPGFVEVSFPTIAGVGSNGAIVHYRAEKGSDILKYLDKSNPILIDSGGQYEYGTTDVTRTWHFGEPTAEFVDFYTRVLKGHIGLDAMIFPVNTPGFVLDVLARKALWEVGKDYGHGTGHGVGAALNVHEGPHSISARWTNKEVLKKGMIVSDEPGYYDDGNFGIRIENLLECTYVNEEDNAAYDKGLKEDDDGFPQKLPGQKTFLKFEKLTQIPIQKNLFDVMAMSSFELNWIDSYHEEILAKIGPMLQDGSPAMMWLQKSCEKIDRTEK